MSLGDAFVTAKADTTGFLADLERKLKAALRGFSQPVKIHVEPTGLPEFRRLISEATKDTRAKIHIEPVGLPEFRRAITEATKNSAVKVKIEPADIAGFKAQVQRELRGIDAVKVKVLPEGLAAFRSQLQRDLRGLAPINIKLTVSQAELTRVRNQIERELRRLPPLQLRFDSAHVLTTLASLTAALNQASAAAQRLSASMSSAGAASNNAAGSFGRAGSALGEGFSSAANLAAEGLGNVLKGVVAADAAFATFGIKGVLDMEQLETAIAGVVRGNAAAQGKTIEFADALKQAKQQIIEIQNFGKIAPQFSLQGLASASRNIQTLGLNGKEALDTVKILTNALVAAGNASDESLRGAVLPLLQAASTGKFLGQDLNQLAQRLPGVFSRGDVLKRLKEIIDAERTASKQTKLTGEQFKSLKTALSGKNLTAEQFEKIRQAGLPANQTIQAVLQSLKESPVAADALKNASKTVRGSLFTLRRTIEQRTLGLFDPIRDQLRKALSDLTPEVSKAFDRIGPGIRNFILRLIPFIASLAPTLAEGFARINDVLFKIFDAVQPFIKPTIQAIVDGFSAVGNIVAFIAEKFQSLRDQFSGTSTQAIALRSVVDQIGQALANIGPVLSTVFNALQSIAGVLVVLAVPFAALVKILTDIADSPVGKALLEVATVVGAVTAAVLILNTGLVVTTVVMGTTAAASSLLTLRFVAGALAAGQFGVALQAVRGAALLATTALTTTLGPIGALIVAGTAAFAVGYELGKALRGLISPSHEAQGAVYTVATAMGTFQVQAQNAAQAAHIVAQEVKNIPANASITVTDNFGNVLARLSVLDASLIAFRKAHPELSGFNKTDLELAQLREAQAQAKLQNGINGPIIPGTTRPQNPTPPIQVPKLPPSAIPNVDKISKAAGGAKAAADKAKEAAKNFAEAIRSIIESLNEDFRKGLISDPADQVRKTLQALVKSIEKAFDDAGKKRPSKLIERIKSDNLALQKLAKERDGIIKVFVKGIKVSLGILDDAISKSKEVRDSVLSTAKLSALDFDKILNDTSDTLKKLEIRSIGVAGSFQVMGKAVVESTKAAGDATTHTAAQFAEALKNRKNQILQFQKDIAKLIKIGIPKQIIDQILTSTDFASATALAGADKKTVASIKASQASIEQAAKELGNTAADQFFRQGGQIVNGLIQGLKDKKSDIVKQMTEIADALIRAIKKSLKIKSPSRVAHEIGGHFVQGLVNGLDGGLVAKAGQGAVDSLKNLQVPGVDLVASLGLKAAHANLLEQVAEGRVQRMHPEDLKTMTAALAGARPHAAQKEIHQTVTVTAPLRERFTHAEATAHLNRIAASVRH